MEKIWTRVKPWMIPAGLTLLLYLLLKFVFLIGYVPTPSMEPTLPEGSFIFGSRIYQELKTGDIIVFEKDGVLLVKRIAAVGGETIEADGKIYTVPKGRLFVLGDNKQNSFDSRYWEEPFVDEANVIAKVIGK